MVRRCWGGVKADDHSDFWFLVSGLVPATCPFRGAVDNHAAAMAVSIGQIVL
jgi:hypothetical protein